MKRTVGRVGPVLLEDWNLARSQEMRLFTVRPLDEIHCVLGNSCHSQIDTMIAEEDDMRPRVTGAQSLMGVKLKLSIVFIMPKLYFWLLYFLKI